MRNVVTLPPPAEIMRRLTEADENPHYREKLYPLLAAHGGQEKAPAGINLMLALAISDYCDGLPPIMGQMLWIQADEFINALVGDHPEFATETKEALRRTLDRQ